MLGGEFAEYIDWRIGNPSDDIMTDLLNAEFEDHDGTRRRLTRRELLTYIYVIAGAGNETSARLIGWTAKVLADHPDQRRELVADRSLIPNAVEEILRFENPAPTAARYVANDVELHDTRVPAGAAMVILMGAANRDERKYLTPTVSTSNARSGCSSRSGMVPISASGPHSPAWRAGSRWMSSSRASRSGTSTSKGRRMATSSTVRGWECLPLVIA